MDIRQIGLQLKKELEQDCSEKKAMEIAQKISSLPISDTDKEHIINYIKYPLYDHITGRKMLTDADNSKFLELVALMSSKIKKK